MTVHTVTPGAQGYAEHAEALIRQYESIAFVDKHRNVLHLIPSRTCQVLDIGAGTGADAAWFAARGHRVVAVEPTREFREAGQTLHPENSIEWIDDGLPRLDVLMRREQRFDLVTLTAVWMHLDPNERPVAMRVLAALLKPDALVVMSLRHGPIPEGRRMFEVTAEETIRLAQSHGLKAVFSTRTDGTQHANRAAGVEWTHLAFQNLDSM